MKTRPRSCDRAIACSFVESRALNLMFSNNDRVRYFGGVPDHGAGLRPDRTPEIWRYTRRRARSDLIAVSESSGRESGMYGWFGVRQRPAPAAISRWTDIC